MSSPWPICQRASPGPAVPGGEIGERRRVTVVFRGTQVTQNGCSWGLTLLPTFETALVAGGTAFVVSGVRRVAAAALAARGGYSDLCDGQLRASEPKWSLWDFKSGTRDAGVIGGQSLLSDPLLSTRSISAIC
jgi:hypothetical protein